MRAVRAYINYIPMGILVLQCFGWWIYQIPVSQNKARKTPFQYVLYLPPPERHIPSAWAKYGKTFLATGARFILRCKITNNFWNTQIYRKVFLIFAYFDAERRREDLHAQKNLHIECRFINFNTLSGLFWLAKVLRCCATYLHYEYKSCI